MVDENIAVLNVKNNISYFSDKYRKELSSEITKLEEEMFSLTDHYGDVEKVINAEVKTRTIEGLQNFDKEYVFYKKSRVQKIYAGTKAIGGVVGTFYLGMSNLIGEPLDEKWILSAVGVLVSYIWFFEGLAESMNLTSNGHYDSWRIKIYEKYFTKEKA